MQRQPKKQMEKPTTPTAAEHRFEVRTRSEIDTVWACPACDRTVSYSRLTHRFSIIEAGDAMVNHGAVSASAHVALHMGAVDMPAPPRNLH